MNREQTIVRINELAGLNPWIFQPVGLEQLDDISLAFRLAQIEQLSTVHVRRRLFMDDKGLTEKDSQAIDIFGPQTEDDRRLKQMSVELNNLAILFNCSILEDGAKGHYN